MQEAVQRNALERAIVSVCSLVLWLTSAVIFVILTANTVLRYVSGSSLQWANELPELLFPWLVMAGVVRDVKEYPDAGHGFLNDSDPADVPALFLLMGKMVRTGYHAPSAEDARQRIVAFFNTHLRS